LPDVQTVVEKQSAVHEQTIVKKQKELHSTIAHIEVQTDDILIEDKEVQTEAQPSERMQTMNAGQRNRKI